MSNGWQIAIVGATGLVGEAIIELLQENELPISELVLLASQNSLEESVRFRGKSLPIRELADFEWERVQVAFFVATEAISAEYADKAAQSGCVVFDLSSYFSNQWDIPLWVPQVNDDVLYQYRDRNIIAIAHPIISQLALVLKPIVDEVGIRRAQITNLLPASAFGKQGIAELAGQSARLLNGLPVDEGNLFQHQLAFNLLPLQRVNKPNLDRLALLCVEQMRRVLSDPQCQLSISCLVAPVFYGNTQLISVEAYNPLSVPQIEQLFMSNPALLLSDDILSPVHEGSEQHPIVVGHLQEDVGIENMFNFMSVTDNVRYCAAKLLVDGFTLFSQEYMG